MNSKEKLKSTLLILVPSLLVLIIGIIISWLFNIPFFSIQIPVPKNYYPGDTKGAIVLTGYASGNINTGVIIEIPRDPRGYLDYVIANGEAGIDYISRIVTNQPDMSSNAGSENTNTMHEYLYNTRIQFNLPKTDKQGYIMFVTDKKIGNSNNLFIGLNGITIGWIDKTQKISTYNNNEYLYELNSLPLIGNKDYRFLKNLAQATTLSINGVVGENGNSLKQIIIFFK